ncbi:MAG: methyltransferase domain-containing protein [Proteobacteria bacterium]|nr:MAG: methyltransferase domain-containing protein [Pseudomonadota bacterium]
MQPLSTEVQAHRFVQIDEDGYFKMSEVRVCDVEIGRDWMKNVSFDPKSSTVTAKIDNVETLVEAFDAPYVVLSAEKSAGRWIAHMPYGHSENFELKSLSLDEWDRFHGVTERGIPFVFSRSAQAGFFDLVEEYDDDSITDEGIQYEMKPWLESSSNVDTKFWNDSYVEGETPWDTRQEFHPSLPRLVPPLKLMRSRVLVAGCGRGHDAAWFAQQGHIVTAIDYSAEAIKQAKDLYGHIPDLTFVQADAFNLPQNFDKSFDIVFEHTLYCAITPEKRNDLVKAWRRVLVDNGHLMAMMFASEKRRGPPWGGSEWEIRHRLAKTFRVLYWQRLRDSVPKRLGSELFVYSQKLPALR